MQTKIELFTQIAREHLSGMTLDAGAVTALHQALDAAYRAGQSELLEAAEMLLEARDDQMVTIAEWRRLRRAVRHAYKQSPLPKP